MLSNSEPQVPIIVSSYNSLDNCRYELLRISSSTTIQRTLRNPRILKEVMAMLMEIAAANAIFKTLSVALKNGKSLYELGTQVSDYLGATQEIKSKAGDANSKGSALECFQAQELLNKQRSELEWHLKKSRLNGWSDFVRYEAEWHRERREEEQEKVNAQIRRNAKLQKDVSLAINVGVCMLLAMGLLFGIAVYYRG